MFGKIKDRLKNVFSTSDDIKEDEANTEIVDEEEQIQEELDQLDNEQQEIDELEKEIEEEINDTEEEIDELEHVDEEKLDEEDTKKELKELDKEQEEIDKLDKEVEEEIKDTEEEIDELEHVDEEELDEKNIQEEPKEKKGFFSKIFSKKEESEPKEDEEEKTQEVLVEEESSKEIEEEIKESENLEESTTKDNQSEESGGIFQSVFKGITHKTINEGDFSTLWVELELFLLEINIAYEIVEKIENKLKEEVIHNKFSRLSLKQKTKEVLIDEIKNVLHLRQVNFDDIINERLDEKKPVVMMMLGVNGTGKTTTIGKIIHYFQKQNKSIVVAAADTFRAAAVEQVKEHCDKLGVKCIAHKQGADPAAVCFDAIEHAKAKQIDIVLIDTAGRMPNNKNLMAELQKIKRVSQTDEVIFIGDSISGNDLIDQIALFNEGLGITGVILTKVDTDERPGSVVTTAYSINTPIYFLGCGQTYDDLIPYDSKLVAEQLFNEE